MEIWASIVVNSDGKTDCEFLDSEPTESFRDDLWDGIKEGTILRWEIRMGYLNGGDSLVEYSSEG
jgi:hypothetical protein